MPVSIKSMNGLAAIKKVGIPQELYDWLIASPIEVKLTATEFRFMAPTGDGWTEKKVAVTLDLLQSLSAGTITPAKKGALSSAVTTVVSELKALAEIHGWVAQPPAEGALGKLPPLNVEPKPLPVAKPDPWPMFDLAQLMTAPTVKLRDATQMYQPVQGTSQGSRYFMVAAGKGIRIAARYAGHNLSVRIEGSDWGKHATAIAGCGFSTVDKKKDYASIHLEVGTDLVMASKTLGALLLGLGIPLETPLPQLQVIAKKEG
ncbi:hypothetical protein [Sinorhizobium fredii]|uniref:hypothetical protein n=1 Tax=Rhizobium fredii TaxID=380 RepID=UPI0012972B6E|nr:hypothetical protein [Sinorhizobium fredii]MQW94028.1 hypothetical protein [Sinorhizobium fredii]